MRSSRAHARLARAGLLFALVAAGCGAGTAPSAGTGSGTAASAAPGTVELVQFQFSPRTLEVTRGTSLTFVNRDAAAHTVTEGSDGAAAPDSRFDDRVDEGGTVVVSFDAAGTYQITCTFHPTMSMTVTVRP